MPSGPVSNPIGSRVEQLAQSLAERIVPLIVDAIDIDSILDKVDIDRHGPARGPGPHHQLEQAAGRVPATFTFASRMRKVSCAP